MSVVKTCIATRGDKVSFGLVSFVLLAAFLNELLLLDCKINCKIKIMRFFI